MKGTRTVLIFLSGSWLISCQHWHCKMGRDAMKPSSQCEETWVEEELACLQQTLMTYCLFFLAGCICSGALCAAAALHGTMVMYWCHMRLRFVVHSQVSRAGGININNAVMHLENCHYCMRFCSQKATPCFYQAVSTTSCQQDLCCQNICHQAWICSTCNMLISYRWACKSWHHDIRVIRVTKAEWTANKSSVRVILWLLTAIARCLRSLNAESSTLVLSHDPAMCGLLCSATIYNINWLWVAVDHIVSYLRTSSTDREPSAK